MSNLKNLCLQSVCKDLNFYINLYNTDCNPSIKKNLECLRRFHSLEILEMLYGGVTVGELRSVDEFHFDFLINEYLKTLDLAHVKKYPWELVVRKFAEIGSSLETVYSRDIMPWDEVFCHMPNLEKAKIHFFKFSYIHGILKFCPKLRSLIIFWVENSEDFCDKESKLELSSEIREISFEWIVDARRQPLTKCATYFLQNLPLLQNLNFEEMHEVFYSLHKKDLNNLDVLKPYNLTHLSLHYKWLDEDTFNDTMKICVTLCPHLKSFSTFIFCQENLDLISKLPELEQLLIERKGKLSVALDTFLENNGRKLVSLTMVDLVVPVANLFRACRNIQKLELLVTSFSDNFNYMPMLYNLKFVTFMDLNLKESTTAKGVTSILKASPNLQSLRIYDCKVFPSDVKTAILKSCQQGTIKDIWLNGSSVETKFALDVLLTCSTLETINFYGCTIDDYSNNMKKFEALAMSLPNKPKINQGGLFIT